jgi:hypothetical protein
MKKLTPKVEARKTGKKDRVRKLLADLLSKKGQLLLTNKAELTQIVGQ